MNSAGALQSSTQRRLPNVGTSKLGTPRHYTSQPVSKAVRQKLSNQRCHLACSVSAKDASMEETSAAEPLIDEEAAGPSTSMNGSKKKNFQSSWDAKEAGAAAGQQGDYLHALGGADYNINVDHGQNSQMLDTLFTGSILGLKSDIADGSLRAWEFRQFNHIVGDYYIAPQFLEAITMHIVKNYLADQGAFDIQTRVPLILGVWGGKGQGKTFQTELAFKKLGVEPIVMSAGELEHEWAGTPGRLIRERYRRASELSRVRGKLSCLLINDIDAGLGHFDNTQVTVNNQIVVGTLMNICDHPNRVSIAQGWRENDTIRRTPIIVTGNDLSTMFAPLIRDGRMAKFYWEPTKENLVNILYQMYKDDGLSKEDMGKLLDVFCNQPLDFFGALRASTYDAQIREWIKSDVVGGEISEDNENMKELGKRLINRENLPTFEPVQLTLNMLLKEGMRLVEEQEAVNNLKLSVDYMKGNKSGKKRPSILGMKG